MSLFQHHHPAYFQDIFCSLHFGSESACSPNPCVGCFPVSSHSSNITLRLTLRSPRVWLNNVCVLNTPWTAHLIKNKRWLTEDGWVELCSHVSVGLHLSATAAMAGLGEPKSNLIGASCWVSRYTAENCLRAGRDGKEADVLLWESRKERDDRTGRHRERMRRRLATESNEAASQRDVLGLKHAS